jgi:copper chaperone CopZ
MQTFKFDIYGMTCGGCATGVRRAVSLLDGVDKVEVTLKPGSATVYADPARVTPRRIMSTISALGHLAKVHREQPSSGGTP